ncbi:type II secretion system F family protein [Paraburkholderia sp. J67]|uniref:type II secretion system F family protein n=1 Tax=Paraburkholderia sp. J67 TaxID=2805435 RepID=UPI002ABE4BD7|nr:type II secretion system F family protein [Paraburkholderia sp. J67]
MNTTFLTAAVLLFVAVVMSCQTAWVWWNGRHGAAAKRMAARLESLTAGSTSRREALSILKARRLGAATPLARALPWLHSLDAWLMQSGLPWSLGRLCASCAAFGLAVLAGASLANLPLAVALSGALAGALLPVLHVRRHRARRLRHFERQLPEVCDMLGRALRAGHAFSSAIDMAGTEFPEPAGGEFRTTFDEINYGVSLNDALCGLANRMPVRDLRYLVIAVLIQRETGGNLAELFDSIAWLVRERFKLFDKVRVLSAEGKLSAWVLGMLPIGSAAIINFVNPDFLDPFWNDPVGIRLLDGIVISMICGALWIRRIVRIRV